MPSPLSSRLLRAILLLFSFALLFSTANAQLTLSDLPGLSTATQNSGTGTQTQAQQTTSKGQTTQGTTATTGTGTSTEPKQTTTFGEPNGGQDSAMPVVSIPTTASTSVIGLTDAPTIAGVGIPTLVVPDTSNAPFMQKSNLPEGTVFICVGAALAFIGLGILAWRGLIAWSLHRSVRRAASAQYASEKKTAYHRTSGYPSMYNSENVSLEHLAATNTSYHGVGGTEKTPAHRVSSKPSAKPQRSSRNPTNSSLFFSPTAGAGAGLHSASSRSSTFLPPGYYASGSAAPASGAAIAHVGGATSAGYSRVESHPNSPPATPGARQEARRSFARDADSASHGRKPSNTPRTSTTSRTNLGLGVPPQGRAPSAFLEDLFEHHGNAMGEGERF